MIKNDNKKNILILLDYIAATSGGQVISALRRVKSLHSSEEFKEYNIYIYFYVNDVEKAKEDVSILKSRFNIEEVKFVNIKGVDSIGQEKIKHLNDGIYSVDINYNIKKLTKEELVYKVIEEFVLNKKGDKYIIQDTPLFDDPIVNLKHKTLKKFFLVHSMHLLDKNGKYDWRNSPYKARAYFKPIQDCGTNVVFLTSEQKNEVENNEGKKNKFFKIPHFIDSIEYDELKTSRKKIISCVTRLDLQTKRLMDLIEATKLTKEDFEVHIYGSGRDEEKLKAYIMELGLSDKVKLKGFISDSKKVFMESKVSILLSFYEGLPLTILESLSVGTPVLGYDVRYGLRELIENGKSGYLIPYKDIKTLSKYMDYMIITRKDYSKSSLNKAHQYSEKNFIGKWKNAFETGVFSNEQPKTDLNKDYNFTLLGSNKIKYLDVSKDNTYLAELVGDTIIRYNLDDEIHIKMNVAYYVIFDDGNTFEKHKINILENKNTNITYEYRKEHSNLPELIKFKELTFKKEIELKKLYAKKTYNIGKYLHFDAKIKSAKMFGYLLVYIEGVQKYELLISNCLETHKYRNIYLGDIKDNDIKIEHTEMHDFNIWFSNEREYSQEQIKADERLKVKEMNNIKYIEEGSKSPEKLVFLFPHYQNPNTPYLAPLYNSVLFEAMENDVKFISIKDDYFIEGSYLKYKEGVSIIEEVQRFITKKIEENKIGFEKIMFMGISKGASVALHYSTFFKGINVIAVKPNIDLNKLKDHKRLSLYNQTLDFLEIKDNTSDYRKFLYKAIEHNKVAYVFGEKDDLFDQGFGFELLKFNHRNLRVKMIENVDHYNGILNEYGIELLKEFIKDNIS